MDPLEEENQHLTKKRTSRTTKMLENWLVESLSVQLLPVSFLLSPCIFN